MHGFSHPLLTYFILYQRVCHEDAYHVLGLDLVHNKVVLDMQRSRKRGAVRLTGRSVPRLQIENESNSYLYILEIAVTALLD